MIESLIFSLFCVLIVDFQALDSFSRRRWFADFVLLNSSKRFPSKFLFHQLHTQYSLDFCEISFILLFLCQFFMFSQQRIATNFFISPRLFLLFVTCCHSHSYHNCSCQQHHNFILFSSVLAFELLFNLKMQTFHARAFDFRRILISEHPSFFVLSSSSVSKHGVEKRMRQKRQRSNFRMQP
jgi:hypothetical protein